MCHRQIPTLTNGKKEDVVFSLEGGPERGGDLTITLRAMNNGSERRNVDAFIGCMSSCYTGIVSKELAKSSTNLGIEPGKGRP